TAGGAPDDEVGQGPVIARSRAQGDELSPCRPCRRRCLAHRPRQRPGPPLPPLVECLMMKLAKDLSWQEAVRGTSDDLLAPLLADAPWPIGLTCAPLLRSPRGWSAGR